MKTLIILMLLVSLGACKKGKNSGGSEKPDNDSAAPTILSITKKEMGDSPVEEGTLIDLVVTFSEPVKVTGKPTLILNVGGSAAKAVYKNMEDIAYNSTHTFRYTVGRGENGSVQVTGVQLNPSDMISDEVGNQMEEVSTSFLIDGVLAVALCSGSVEESGFNGGDGSADSPYLICTYDQLNKIRDNMLAHYKLAQHIDARPSWSEGESGCTAYDGNTTPKTNPCAGWVPVGDKGQGDSRCDGEIDDDRCFQGYLEGSGYIISHLYFNHINSPASGLFGTTGTNARISNIGLVNVKMNTRHNEGAGIVNSHLGGIVGIHDGLIGNSYITGTLEAISTVSSNSVGGLVGSNFGLISNSYAVGKVSFSNIYSRGGGIVGSSDKNIRNTYSVVTVSFSPESPPSSSFTHSGGIVGHNSIGGGVITNSYATGTVPPATYSGRLIGTNDGTIRGTHYFVDNSGDTNGDGVGNGNCDTCVHKTLAELQGLTSADVSDWSTNNWDFGTTSELPRLKYAPTATYCSDNTYTTQQTCEDASESWIVEGCDGNTGVTCGDLIHGQ